jgi:hypothetical protein
MPTLAALGLDVPETKLLLVNAPDSVLAEAGAMTPRPGFASTLQTSRPAPHVAWWPERSLLDAATLSRLAWMLSSVNGEAWIIVDPSEDELLTAAEVKAALANTALETTEQRSLSTGEVAIRVTARVGTDS